MPAGQSYGGEGPAPRPRGVLEALVAAALGSAFVPAVIAIWQRRFHVEPPEWAKGVIPSIAGAFLISGLWLSARALSRVTTRRRRKTPPPKGDRLSIYVAHLGEDEESRVARESVMTSIRQELGAGRVEVLPAGVQFTLAEGVSTDLAANDAAQKARALLRKKHGDLLIWGQLHTIASRTVIELRFVSAVQDGVEGRRFGFTDKLTLGPGFGPEMGAALAAVAAALAIPAVQDAGKYIAGTLKPIANRLAPLARSLPASMRPTAQPCSTPTRKRSAPSESSRVNPPGWRRQWRLIARPSKSTRASACRWIGP